ncbi:MAG: YceI family protein [Nakamurella sp.]
MTTASTTALTVLSAGTWTGDAVHSDVAIRVRHMAVGKVKGTFELASAELVVPESGIAGATVTAVIDATTVNTKNADRDAHVRSGDFLDVQTHPTITFVSTSVEDFDGEDFKLVGDLTLHGVTRSVVLDAEFAGETVDAYGATRSGFTAHTSVNRSEFGVTIDLAWGAGNKVVGEKIEIAIELEFTKNA